MGTSATRNPAVLLAAVLAIPVVPVATTAAEKPNILFILADDLGWGDLGYYGHPVLRTPNLDRLARQGTLFTDFYVNGSVCSPSRAAFMSGLFPARLRIHGHLADHRRNQARGMPDWVDPTVLFLPRLLKQAGYVTAHVGKWHLGHGRTAPQPSAYGFDYHRCTLANGPGFQQHQKDPYFRARSTAIFVDEVIRFIERNRGKPFYVNLWTLVPHATLHPTPEQLRLYAFLKPSPNLPYASARQIYYGTVTAMDRELGRLFRWLDQQGLTQNTLILFSSDNGPEDIHIRNAGHSGVGSPGPFRGRKRSLYEGGIRVPFIVRWPGHVPAGKVNSSSVVAAVDFLPTLAALVGIPLPKAYRGDGENMLDVLLGSDRPRKRPLFWEWRFRIYGYHFHRSPMLAMRDGNWKLLMNPDGSRIELYDLREDPGEVDNKAAEHEDVVRRMSAELLAWQKTLPPGPIQRQAGSNAYPWPRQREADQ